MNEIFRTCEVNEIFSMYINNKGEFVIKDTSGFDDPFLWINKKVIYNNKIKKDTIYTDINHVEQCKQKLLRHHIKEQEDIIKEAKNKLEFYESVLKTN